MTPSSTDTAGSAGSAAMAGRDDAAEQVGVPCVLMRGGTSKALFFHEHDVPPAGPARDRLLKRAMGTPDALQIDGLGGSRLVTSKIAIIQRSTRPGIDVDYTFAQCDVERDTIFHIANCGNISSAVGPFAVDEGLVEAVEPVTTVRIHNTNTGKLLVARVPVAGGKARVHGACVIPGVPGSGAEVLMDFAGAVGAHSGRLLPSGAVVETVRLEDGRSVQVTVTDVVNPCVFIDARDLGMSGSELPDAISADRALIEMIGEIQAKAGQAMGLWPDWTQQHLPGLPLAVVVAAPADYVDANGATQAAASMDLRARLVFLGKCHDSMAGAGAMSLAAASRVRGSVVARVVDAARLGTDSLRIGHPLGVLEARVVADTSGPAAGTRFSVLSFPRTARRLMAGTVYVPAEFAAANAASADTPPPALATATAAADPILS